MGNCFCVKGDNLNEETLNSGKKITLAHYQNK